MPNTREKLIEICRRYDGTPPCDACENPIGSCSMCGLERLIDYLIANGVTIPEWISVKDRLPDTAERVLVCKTWLGTVYKPVYGYYQDYPNQKGCWYVLTEFGYYPQREVTHWMPLPQPPKGE